MNRNHFAAAFLAGVIAIAGLTSTTVAQRKPGAGTALVDLSMPAVAISPDGKQVALILRAGEKTQLHIRLTGAQESKPVPGTDGAVTPLFSPDGKWVAFFADGKLRKVALDSGHGATLCDGGTGPRAAVWTPHDTIIVTPDPGPALLQ